MKDYKKLIKALRLCQNDDGCESCAYKKDMLQKFCWLNAMSDAADAIEEILRTRTDELNAAYRQGYDAARMEVKKHE